MKVDCTDANFPRRYVSVISLDVGRWFELDGRANLIVAKRKDEVEVVTFAPSFVRTIYFVGSLLSLQVNPITVNSIDVRFTRITQ